MPYKKTLVTSTLLTKWKYIGSPWCKKCKKAFILGDEAVVKSPSGSHGSNSHYCILCGDLLYLI